MLQNIYIHELITNNKCFTQHILLIVLQLFSATKAVKYKFTNITN